MLCFSVNAENFVAADVMNSPVRTVHVRESVAHLANLLLSTDRGAFPVVKYNSRTRNEHMDGIITRYYVSYGIVT